MEFSVVGIDYFKGFIYTDKEASIEAVMMVGALSVLSALAFVIWTSFRKAWDRWAVLLLLSWISLGFLLTY